MNTKNIKVGTLHEDGTVSVTVPKYTTVYDDGDKIVMECEERITVNDETGEKHCLMIEIMNWYEATGEHKDEPYVCFIQSVLDIESLTKEQRDCIVRCSDIKENDITAIDVLEYGFTAPLEQSDFQKSKDFTAWINEVLPKVKTMYEFYMDRPVNRIGTTGWKYIRGEL